MSYKIYGILHVLFLGAFQIFESSYSSFSIYFKVFPVIRILDVLWGQPIKLAQVAYTSELRENQWNDLLFFEIVSCHSCGASEVQTTNIKQFITTLHFDRSIVEAVQGIAFFQCTSLYHLLNFSVFRHLNSFRQV